MLSFKGRRWKLLGLATVVFVALASSVYAYWRINASATPYVTATSPPLELRMELDKTEYLLNETVAIHLSLKNIGDKTIKMFVPSLQQFVGFVIKDENNTVVLDFPYGGLLAIDDATLEPGGQISRTFDWPQIGHYPDGHGGVYQDSVPPGTYHIIGRTEPYWIGSFDAFEHWTPWIETPPITLTIS